MNNSDLSKVIEAGRRWLETHDSSSVLSDDIGYTYGLIKKLCDAAEEGAKAQSIVDEHWKTIVTQTKDIKNLWFEIDGKEKDLDAAKAEHEIDRLANIALVEQVEDYREKWNCEVEEHEKTKAELVQAKKCSCGNELTVFCSKCSPTMAYSLGQTDARNEIAGKIEGMDEALRFDNKQNILSAIAQRVREGKVGG